MCGVSIPPESFTGRLELGALRAGFTRGAVAHAKKAETLLWPSCGKFGYVPEREKPPPELTGGGLKLTRKKISLMLLRDLFDVNTRNRFISKWNPARLVV